MVVRTYFRTNLANTELSLCPVGSLTTHLEFHAEFVKVRRSHLCRPPQSRTSNIQLGKFIGLEGDILAFTGSQFHWLRKLNAVNPPLQRAFYGLAGRVLQQGTDRQM